MKAEVLPEIHVHNRQRKIALDRGALEEFARAALPLCLQQKGRGLTTLEEIHVILVSDLRISDLHRRFMRISGPTDVITFLHGEIFISAETARRQAKTFQTSLGEELRLYLVHGLLHLQGFDDREPHGRRKMQAAQERILSCFSSRSRRAAHPHVEGLAG